MDIHEIANTMSNAEAGALEAFQACAAGFDAFNKQAATVVKGLLQENQQLLEENNDLRIQLHHLTGQDVHLAGPEAADVLDSISHESRDPEDAEEGFKIGGTD